MKSAPPLAPRPSLSILSIGWFSTAVQPPFLHPTVQNGSGRSRGDFVLYPRDGSWSIFVREFQTVSPMLAFRLADDNVGAQVADDPFLNPYGTGDLAELVAFLQQEASKRDLIVLGYCNGEGMRRVRLLPPSTRRKTVMVHWDPIKEGHVRELALLGTLGAVSRKGFVDWLVDRIAPPEEVLEALPDAEMGHVQQTDMLHGVDGTGTGLGA